MTLRARTGVAAALITVGLLTLAVPGCATTGATDAGDTAPSSPLVR